MSETISHDLGFYEFFKGYVGARPDSQVNFHLLEFCEGIIGCNQYSWIGVVQVADVLDRERLHLYFLEKYPPKPYQDFSIEENRAVRKRLDHLKGLGDVLGNEFHLTTYIVLGNRITPEEAGGRIVAKLNDNEYMLDAHLLWKQEFREGIKTKNRRSIRSSVLIIRRNEPEIKQECLLGQTLIKQGFFGHTII